MQALRRLSKEDYKLKTTLDYIVRLSQKKNQRLWIYSSGSMYKAAFIPSFQKQNYHVLYQQSTSFSRNTYIYVTCPFIVLNSLFPFM